MPNVSLSIHGHVATVTLHKPAQANRLDADDVQALQSHVLTVNANDDVRVLRLQADGRYFCSGYDIAQINGPHELAFDRMVDAIEEARPATIAVIQGGIYGGATDMALACDFRIGARGVDMFMPAARLGLHFYQRGLERYVTRLGLDTAKRLLLTAQRVDADEMLKLGFLTQLVDADWLAAAADELTHTLVGMAPQAMLGMKKHLNRIARGVLDEAELQHDVNRAAHSQDLKEGIAAWVEKRPPRFTGH